MREDDELILSEEEEDFDDDFLEESEPVNESVPAELAEAGEEPYDDAETDALLEGEIIQYSEEELDTEDDASEDE